jgi:hypothetical protein
MFNIVDSVLCTGGRQIQNQYTLQEWEVETISWEGSGSFWTRNQIPLTPNVKYIVA